MGEMDKLQNLTLLCGKHVLSNKVVRVKSWEEFKQLIIKHKPESIAYNIEMGVPARNLTALRLILPIKGVQYVFIDNAVGNRLRRTRIPLHMDNLGNLYIKDEDVKNFVRSESKIKGLKLHSYWSM